MSAAAVPMPPNIAQLPRDKHGRPIPWFVIRDEHGVPDFRIVRSDWEDALRFDWCWVCGRSRGRHAAFVAGPMCAVNRTSPEPPSHLACAVYSAQACPWLSTPSMTRRGDLLAESPANEAPAGMMITRNPGVALVWSSRTWAPFPVPGGGVLFNMGTPTATSWWARGAPATRAEVTASIDSGLPLLHDVAQAQSPRAVAELGAAVVTALQLLPE